MTIQHAGGGFDHGVNPAYSWAITGDPVASLRFSPTSGTLQAHHSVQVQVVVAPGTCPNSITITSKNETAHFSPFLFDPRTGQCIVVAPVISTGRSGAGSAVPRSAQRAVERNHVLSWRL